MPPLVASAAAATTATVAAAAAPTPKFQVVVPPPPLTSRSNEFEKFPEEDDIEDADQDRSVDAAAAAATTATAAAAHDHADGEADDDDGEPIEPAYYYEGGGIPVFTPTMDQFKSFSRFVDKINHYGMQSGIIKVIPPKEWTDSLPPLDGKVRDIRIKNPIEQHIAGISGEYRQTNVQKQRTYNLPEWRQLCEGSDHQPPAKRGERRRGQPQPAVKRHSRPRRGAANSKEELPAADDDDGPTLALAKTSPPTPESPADKTEDATPEPAFGRQPASKPPPPSSRAAEETPGPEPDAPGRQPKKSAAALLGRRKTAKERQEDRELADEAAFEGFDYRMLDADQFTPERCAELERAYWRTLTYNSPLYGADMPGSLFEDSTTSWNVSRLENLLDCLGKKLPGVNTAYLYLGMWKSTFSWHLEDMDLYSINYIHFGAPKQWYSISRPDKIKFEQVMRSIWPNEAKKCSQFLRHKTFLVSPALLRQHGIEVNRLVHHQREFVITFPFGYHSGYNVGYNCAESVNFAQRSWLEFGRDAKKCECVGDSVFVDVDEIERKLRGEPTEDEYDSDDDSDDDDDEFGYYAGGGVDGRARGTGRGEFPTPPESVVGKPGRGRPRKRRLEDDGAGGKAGKRAKVKQPKVPTREPCALCPNDIPSEPLLYTENGDQAHRLCAIYTPETYFKWDHATSREIVANIAEIPKARLELKCVFCRQKKGSCFQCSAKKCTRAYHATCAAAAGVLVNMVDVQVTDENGEAYAQTSIDYRCKIHRPKRPKDWDTERLEDDPLIRKFSMALIKDDVIQMQFFGGDIFAGVVEENRNDEGTVLVRVLPKGEQVMEIEWKWILAQDPSETNFPDAITTAPLYPDPHYPPARRTKVANKDLPEPEEMFGDGDSQYKWGELVVELPTPLPDQEPVRAWWYYLGELSTEYIPKYSEDPRIRVHNPASSFIPQKPPRVRTYKPQNSVIKQEPGLCHSSLPPQQQRQQQRQHVPFQNPMVQPSYAPNSMPQGYNPQFHNSQLIGYGPPPRSQFQPPPHMMASSSPPQAGGGGGQGASPPPNQYRNASALPPPTPPDRRPPLSLPLQRMFGEAPPPPPQQRPQYVPHHYNVALSPSPMDPMQQQQQQQYRPRPQPPMGGYTLQPIQSQLPQTRSPYQHPQAGSYAQPPYRSPSQQQQQYQQRQYSPAQHATSPAPTQSSSSSTFVGQVADMAPAGNTAPPAQESDGWGKISAVPLADITAALEKLARRERAEKEAQARAQAQPQQQQQLEAMPEVQPEAQEA